jgi:ferritin-like metal-binding protein YciE
MLAPRAGAALAGEGLDLVSGRRTSGSEAEQRCAIVFSRGRRAPIPATQEHRRTSMALETLHDLMVEELRDIYHAEHQLVRALPKMAKSASTPGLRQALEEHLEETQGHVTRLEEAFDHLGLAPKGRTCKGMQGLLEEGAELLDKEGQGAVVDAGIIASAQRVEHYEISAYGTATAFARMLGNETVARLLEQSLEEEKAADERLNQLAESDVNRRAAKAGGEAGTRARH